ncbi:MAG: right-handed parallel beta-helix repeat-containing protein [Candidatus Paceibacterota bacterium]
MKTKIIVFAITLFFAPSFAFAYTPVSGTLPGDTTWTIAGGPYVISTASVAVPAGVTLTIDPGVIVKFDSGMSLNISGILNTSEIATEQIYFTSLKDDIVEDTNGDLGLSSPASGDWGGINIASGGAVNLNHATVRYGGTNISSNGGFLSLSNSVISSGSSYGVSVSGSGSVALTGNTFSDNASGAVSVDFSGGLNLSNSGNTANGTGTRGIIIGGTIVAEQRLVADGLPYVLFGTIIIPSGKTLNIDPGVIMKLSGAYQNVPFLNIIGTLNALGSESLPIYFTSLKDDTIGGDTNADNEATSPAPYNWGHIKAVTGGTANFDYSIIRYDGYNGLYNNGGTLNVSNSVISNCSSYGIKHENGTTTIDKSIIKNNTTYGIYALGSGDIHITGNTFAANMAASLWMSGGLIISNSGNKASGTGVRGFYVSGIMSANQTWTADGIPYIIPSTGLTVASGKTLILKEGVALKLIFSNFLIYGNLVTQGTKEKPVYITSYNDDTAFGDTNENGSATTPAPDDWGSIVIYSMGSASLDHSAVRYGGRYSTGSASNIYNNGTLTVTNSEISHASNHGIMNGTGSASITQSSIHNNLRNGIYNGSAVPVNATNNWWGSDTGPKPIGTGDAITGLVDYIPFLTSDPTKESVASLSDATETENDGTQDTKGVADKTEFTFNVLYTGTTAPSDVTLWTNANDTTKSYALTLSATTTNDGDFQNGEWYVFTGTFPQGKYGYHFEANGGTLHYPTTGELSFTTGYSNIIFFPGMMGSRLFEQSSVCFTAFGEDERWYSGQDCYQQRLALDANGKSLFPLYTKEGTAGAIDSIGKNIYASFMNDLETWKNGQEHTIADYKIIPYDWRLSLEDILQNGSLSSDGKLSYGTSQGFYSAYIYNKLKAMQESSDTGKVTLIGHSNGGLIIKALVQKLKDNSNPLANEIDDIIFVAVPQVGTPDATAGILFGVDIGPGGVVISPMRTRSLFKNMPVGYNLLPSPAFGVSATEPFIEFKGNIIDTATTERYGASIDTYAEFTNYLLGAEGRSTPTEKDLSSPEKANAILLASSTEVHRILDQWTPGPNTTVSEIAGWGLPTPAGLRYSKNKECIVDWRTYIPIIGNYVPRCSKYRDVVKIDDRRTINGDKTVMEKSAHYMPVSDTTKKYWVNLEEYNKPLTTTSRDHKDILEVTQLRPFILSIIKKNISVPQFITTDNSTLVSTKKFVEYTIHSPLNLNVYDTVGNHTGISPETGFLEVGIKGSQYFELGESKTIMVPAEIAHTLNLDAYASGSFTLDVETLVGDTVTASTTFEAVPTATTTKATLVWDPQTEITPSTWLNVDFNADNVIDVSLPAVVNGTALYDVTPPEAVISFNPTTNDVVFMGKDEGGDTTVKMTATSTGLTPIMGKARIPLFAHPAG